MEYVENLYSLIEWYKDQIEVTKKKIKEQEDFLASNHSSLLSARKQE